MAGEKVTARKIINTKGLITLTKVVRLPLISKTEKDGKEIPYKDICRVLWDIQNYTREIKNKVVQVCWEWQGFCDDFKKNTGEYPKEREYFLKKDPETGEVVKDYAIDGYVYDKFKDYPLYSANNSVTSRNAVNDFKNAKKDILKGDQSVLSYKANQPLDLHKNAIKLEYKDEKFFIYFSLLNGEGKKKYNIKTPFKFEMTVKDKSSRTILERCLDGIYDVSSSKLIYNEKKKQWFLNLSYSFEAANHNLDKDKILGIDLGVVIPLVASVNGDKSRFSVSGDEVDEFRKRVEGRRRAIRKQRPRCGDGSIGHGYNTRMKPALKISDKIARFRDTFNHKTSRSLIEYALKNGCGTIQMEKLTGIKEKTKKKKSEEDEPVTRRTNKMRFLKDWTYYDLQAKIEYKAKENGIDVVYIDPKYTSQRCSKCGAIHKESRPEQARFCCVECGFEENADYNASQNIALKDIEDIIKNT